MNQEELISRINYLTSKLIESINEASAHYANTQKLSKEIEQLQHVITTLKTNSKENIVIDSEE